MNLKEKKINIILLCYVCWIILYKYIFYFTNIKAKTARFHVKKWNKKKQEKYKAKYIYFLLFLLEKNRELRMKRIESSCLVVVLYEICFTYFLEAFHYKILAFFSFFISHFLSFCKQDQWSYSKDKIQAFWRFLQTITNYNTISMLLNLTWNLIVM